MLNGREIIIRDRRLRHSDNLREPSRASFQALNVTLAATNYNVNVCSQLPHLVRLIWEIHLVEYLRGLVLDGLNL